VSEKDLINGFEFEWCSSFCSKFNFIDGEQTPEGELPSMKASFHPEKHEKLLAAL
jgi:hypothetical protein